MSLQLSTGLRNKMLDTNSLKTIFAAGFIKVYSGLPPASADLAPTGTLLLTISISSGGTGINFASTASGGDLSKSTGEVWSGVVANSGTPSYYRHVSSSDGGAYSTTDARIQGAIGASSEMYFNSSALTSGETHTVDTYSVTLPTL